MCYGADADSDSDSRDHSGTNSCAGDRSHARAAVRSGRIDPQRDALVADLR